MKKVLHPKICTYTHLLVLQHGSCNVVKWTEEKSLVTVNIKI